MKNTPQAEQCPLCSSPALHRGTGQRQCARCRHRFKPGDRQRTTPRLKPLPVLSSLMVEFGRIPCVGTVDATGRVTIIEPRYTTTKGGAHVS